MPGIRTVLRAPAVPTLLIASQVGRLPTAAAPIALLLFARQSQQLAAAGLVVAAYTGAMAAGTPLLARGVDRLQLGGAMVFAAAGSVRRWRGEPAPRHWAGPLRAPRLVALLLGTAFVGAAVGSIPVAVTGYAEAAGHRSLAAWLLAAQGAGALTGGLLYTRGGPTRLPVLAGLLALGYVPLIAAAGVPEMVLLMAVSGLALPPLLTAVFLAADRHAPAGTAVEAFAWVATAFAVGSALGSALNGAITEHGVRFGFAPAPILVAVAAVVLVRP
jgi:hypothetical protein